MIELVEAEVNDIILRNGREVSQWKFPIKEGQTMEVKLTNSEVHTFISSFQDIWSVCQNQKKNRELTTVCLGARNKLTRAHDSLLKMLRIKKSYQGNTFRIELFMH